jgi:hypothetical protein
MVRYCVLPVVTAAWSPWRVGLAWIRALIEAASTVSVVFAGTVRGVGAADVPRPRYRVPETVSVACPSTNVAVAPEAVVGLVTLRATAEVLTGVEVGAMHVV